jgi:hypothetical protein
MEFYLLALFRINGSGQRDSGLFEREFCSFISRLSSLKFPVLQCYDVNWIHLPCHKNQGWTVVNSVMKLGFHKSVFFPS